MKRTQGQAAQRKAMAQAAADPLPPLTPEQQLIVDDACSFRDSAPLFITGQGGTGKTLLIKVITARLLRTGVKFAITASTGIASVDIGGGTFASFMSFNQEGDTPDAEWIEANRARIPSQAILAELLEGADFVADKCTELMAPAPVKMGEGPSRRRTPGSYTVERLRDTQLAIIDEVSMISAQTLDNADQMWRTIRGNAGKVFGGVKLLLFGDCLQLPPIPQKIHNWTVASDDYCFVFQSRAWRAANVRVHELLVSHRHTDPEYARMLSEIRFGIVTPETAAVLTARILPPPTDGQLVTYLYPHNIDVDTMNARKLAELPGRERVYVAEDDNSAKLLNPFKDLRAAARIPLKVDAQVMLLRNMRRSDLSLLGVYVPSTTSGNDTDENSRKAASAEVILANGSMGRIVRFERTPTDTYDNDGNADTTEWPVVRFPRNRGQTPLEVRIEPHRWSKRESPRSDRVATRIQVPLLLSYAISSHKSQGQTISCAVVINSGKAFAFGQVYVMLSRVHTSSQLYLNDFDVSKIRAHPEAVAFYERCAANKRKAIA